MLNSIGAHMPILGKIWLKIRWSLFLAYTFPRCSAAFLFSLKTASALHFFTPHIQGRGSAIAPYAKANLNFAHQYWRLPHFPSRTRHAPQMLN